MYVVYPHKSNRDVGEHLRDYLEDLFLEYKVWGCERGIMVWISLHAEPSFQQRELFP